MIIGERQMPYKNQNRRGFTETRDVCNADMEGAGMRYEYGTYIPTADIKEELQPLIHHLEYYDSVRQQFEDEGGYISDLQHITEVLTKRLRVAGRFRTHDIALTHIESIHSFLYDLGFNDLHLQVRRRDTGVPVYYLYRVRGDYWIDYRLVLEDYYRSDGYPVRDQRFVKLMVRGKETYHLSVAPFRAEVQKLADEGLLNNSGSSPGNVYSYDYTWPSGHQNTTEAEVDRLLYRVGRYVLQASWHEDQQVGVLTAHHLELPRLVEAIELLYLCLSGDLYEIRSILDQSLYLFFDRIYPRPAVGRFLHMLPDIDGITLNDLSEKHARSLYRKLMQAFKRFLNVRLNWGNQQVAVPLYKLLFSNMSRLDLIEDDLRYHSDVRAAADELEAEAQRIIEAIILVTT